MFISRSVFDFDRMFRDMERFTARLVEGTDSGSADSPSLPAATTKDALSARRSPLLGGLHPAVEVSTKDGQLKLRVELPGVDKGDVEITVEDGRLILRGEKKAENERKDESFLLREVRYGRFERSFLLPDNVDAENVTARMKDGVLEIGMPVSEPVGGRSIEIRDGSDESQAA